MVGASDSAVGGVLQQVTDVEAFFSQRLSLQRLDSTFRRELLAAYPGVWHFCYLLEGRIFTTYCTVHGSQSL